MLQVVGVFQILSMWLQPTPIELRLSIQNLNSNLEVVYSNVHPSGRCQNFWQVLLLTTGVISSLQSRLQKGEAHLPRLLSFLRETSLVSNRLLELKRHLGCLCSPDPNKQAIGHSIAGPFADDSLVRRLQVRCGNLFHQNRKQTPQHVEDGFVDEPKALALLEHKTEYLTNQL